MKKFLDTEDKAEKMNKISWKNEQIGKAAENMGEMLAAVQMLEYCNSPELVKKSKEILKQLLERQEKLNSEIATIKE